MKSPFHIIRKNVLMLPAICLTVVHLWANDPVSSIEREALIDLYEATDGPKWIRTWDISAPVSTWHGVKVTGSHVVEINLF